MTEWQEVFPLAISTLQLIEFSLQNIHAVAGHGIVVPLGGMDVAMTHLLLEQVRGRVQFRHDGSVSVPKVVELEINPQLFLDGAGVELHGINGLNLAVWQRVDQLDRGNDPASPIFYPSLFLCPLRLVPFHVFRPLRRQSGEILLQGIVHVHGAFGIDGFGCHQLDYPVLILHLTVNQDGTLFLINIFPLQPITFVDA